MGFCVVPTCNSSSEKGLRLFKFPRNQERRLAWIKNCNRPNWEPTLNHQICELHFDENQFEKNRLDNWRKLKPNAIPTKFDVTKPPSPKLTAVRRNPRNTGRRKIPVGKTNKALPSDSIRKKGRQPKVAPVPKDESICDKSHEKSRYCRTCASKDQFFVSIFENGSIESQLWKIIDSHLPIKVHRGDQLPLQVCQKCFETLNAWDELFGDVIHAEKRLKEILCLDEPSPDEFVATKFASDVDSENEPLIKIKTHCKMSESPQISGEENAIKMDPWRDNSDLSPHTDADKAEIDGGLLAVAPSKLTSGSESQYESWVTNKFGDSGDYSAKEEDDLASGTDSDCNDLLETSTPIKKVRVRLKKPDSTPTKESPNKAITEEECLATKAKQAIPSEWLETLTCENCERMGQPLRYQINSGEVEFSCGQCPKVFHTQSNYIRHLKVHKKETTVEKEYGCRNCLRTYKIENNAIEHEKMCGVMQFYSCTGCGKRCATKEEADAHSYTHHSSCVCDLCGYVFEHSRNLKLHMVTVHESNRTVCHFCGKSFSRKQRLIEHLQKHTGQMDFTCHVCGKGCTNSYAFSLHLATHSKAKPFKCSLCPRTFKHMKYVYLHERAVHLESKPRAKKPAKCSVERTCPDCGKEFRRESALLIHRRSVHEGVNGYICKICNKDFKYSYLLFVHKKKEHFPELCKYSCSYCQKPFPVKTELQKHLRKHTGEKPYVCVDCGKSYSFNGSLNMHIKTQHMSQQCKRFFCSVCDLSFAFQSHLLRHMTAAHVQKLAL